MDCSIRGMRSRVHSFGLLPPPDIRRREQGWRDYEPHVHTTTSQSAAGPVAAKRVACVCPVPFRIIYGHVVEQHCPSRSMADPRGGEISSHLWRGTACARTSPRARR